MGVGFLTQFEETNDCNFSYIVDYISSVDRWKSVLPVNVLCLYCDVIWRLDQFAHALRAAFLLLFWGSRLDEAQTKGTAFNFRYFGHNLRSQFTHAIIFAIEVFLSKKPWGLLFGPVFRDANTTIKPWSYSCHKLGVILHQTVFHLGGCCWKVDL